MKVDVPAFATHFSARNFNAPSSRNRRLKFRQNSDFAVFTAAAASGCVPVSENSFKYPAVCLGKRARPNFCHLGKRARPVFYRLGKRADLFSTVSGNVPKFTFADYLLGKRAQVDFFRLSPLLACYIAFSANFGLLNAMVQSDFYSEVIYSKSFLWVPLLL